MKKYLAYLHSPETFLHKETAQFSADGLITAMVLAYQRAQSLNLYVAAIEEQKNA
jgi:hypothetical protein